LLSVGNSPGCGASLRCSSVAEDPHSSRLALLAPGRISSVDQPARRSGCALAVAAFVLLACGGPRRGPPVTPARLAIRCPVVDASLWLDDRYRGDLGELRGGIALAPGTHRLEIRHDDYHSHYDEVTLRPGQHLVLRVELAERLP
jgi:hypothetical protein